MRAAPVLPAVLRLGCPRRCRRRAARHDQARRAHGLAARLAALAGVVDRDRPLIGHRLQSRLDHDQLDG
jgi:hypothetical protein